MINYYDFPTIFGCRNSHRCRRRWHYRSSFVQNRKICCMCVCMDFGLLWEKSLDVMMTANGIPFHSKNIKLNRIIIKFGIMCLFNGTGNQNEGKRLNFGDVCVCVRLSENSKSVLLPSPIANTQHTFICKRYNRIYKKTIGRFWPSNDDHGNIIELVNSFI